MSFIFQQIGFIISYLLSWTFNAIPEVEGSDYTEKKSMIADFEKVFDSVYCSSQSEFL